MSEVSRVSDHNLSMCSRAPMYSAICAARTIRTTLIIQAVSACARLLSGRAGEALSALYGCLMPSFVHPSSNRRQVCVAWHMQRRC